MIASKRSEYHISSFSPTGINQISRLDIIFIKPKENFQSWLKFFYSTSTLGRKYVLEYLLKKFLLSIIIFNIFNNNKIIILGNYGYFSSLSAVSFHKLVGSNDWIPQQRLVSWLSRWTKSTNFSTALKICSQKYLKLYQSRIAQFRKKKVVLV